MPDSSIHTKMSLPTQAVKTLSGHPQQNHPPGVVTGTRKMQKSCPFIHWVNPIIKADSWGAINKFTPAHHLLYEATPP